MTKTDEYIIPKIYLNFKYANYQHLENDGSVKLLKVKMSDNSYKLMNNLLQKAESRVIKIYDNNSYNIKFTQSYIGGMNFISILFKEYDLSYETVFDEDNKLHSKDKVENILMVNDISKFNTINDISIFTGILNTYIREINQNIDEWVYSQVLNTLSSEG